MKNLRLSELPTLLSWLNEPSTDDCSIQAMIEDFQSDITGLIAVEDLFTPADKDDISEEYTIINTCCRRLAHMVSDLKTIRREAQAAKLISDAGLKPKKGGCLV